MLDSDKFYNQKLASQLNNCLMPFGLNILHLFAKKSLKGKFNSAFLDGIMSIYLDLHAKTPFDYSEELKDFEFSELILDLCTYHGVLIIFNQRHCEILIKSEYSLAKEAFEGMFIQSDICMTDAPKSGEIKQGFLETTIRPI
jgi:hypothetical protein